MGGLPPSSEQYVSVASEYSCYNDLSEQINEAHVVTAETPKTAERSEP